MKAEFDAPAEREFLEATGRYLVEAGPRHALEFDAEVRHVVGRLLSLPGLGTPGPLDTRSMPLRRYPYSIHYRVDGDVVRIFAVAHHRRLPGYWKSRT